MSYLVIRVRSDRGVTKKIRDTMSMLNLTKVNHAVLVPKTPAYEGMLQKAKDYVTWGEVDADTIETLINERGRMAGDKQVTDADVKSCSDHSTVKALSKAIASGEATTKDVEGMKRSSDSTLREGRRDGAESREPTPSVGPLDSEEKT